MQAKPATLLRRLTETRGMALVMVVSVLTLATVLLLALLSTTQTELKSTVAFADGSSARLNADTAVNIVINQIQKASRQDAGTAGYETWTSQPGMARQYQQTGDLLSGNKLYSDQNMTETSEAAIIADTPEANWNTKPDHYVDLNEPVLRADPANPGAAPRVFFPIMDPRAYSGDPLRSVEGFSYTQSANGTSGAALGGVVLPGGGTGDNQRLPMPVEWLYMLKDGTLGYLDTNRKFVGAGGVKATAQNPIVSRLAFWTDDESTKININTAGEGTFWDTPRLYHVRDGDWARYQPMNYEYQRYPGHPATVCMSTLLFPGQDMNPLASDAANFQKALDFKEKIYDLMPKILPGGSKAGSVLVPAGRNFTPTAFAEVQNALRERLFATVDEFLLRPTMGTGGMREEIDLDLDGAWSGLSRAELVERLRPFLTARSRSPELNPFGMPKVAMWPLHSNVTEDYRTVFDRTIAYCGSIAGKPYYFTRQDSTSQNEINGIPRNRQLYEYLLRLTGQPIPGFGTSRTANFNDKYGDNLQQILVEIFDYIRSTNLYDDNLAEKHVGNTPSVPGLPDSRAGAYDVGGGLKSKTFTPLRNQSGGSYAGHGQVMPTVLQKRRNEVYRGMGRFLTISEVGIHFITTAEGTAAAGGKNATKITPQTPPAAAGYTPPTWRGGIWGNSSFWYSNFPPLSPENQDPTKGFYKNKYPSAHELEGHPGDSGSHPGYNPVNWNWTLDVDTPLEEGMKRVQATILLEWFCPSTGWTLINPDIQIEIDASSLTVGGRKLFPMNGGKVTLKPYQHMSSAWGVYPRGGTISYRPFLQGRKLPAVAKGVNGYQKGSILHADTNIPGSAPYTAGQVNYTYYSSRTGILKDCIQYNLVSDFFDIPANGTIDFSGGEVEVRILPTNSNAARPPALQIFKFNFDRPNGGFPTPILATKNEDTRWGQHWDGKWWVNQPVPAPYWWAYHADGALGRDRTGKITPEAAANAARMGGRFRFIGSEIGSYGNLPSTGTYNRGNLVIPDDVLKSLVLSHGDPRLTMGQYEVPTDEFVRHRYYHHLEKLMGHNIVLAHWSDGPGLDKGEDKRGWRLVKDANYSFSYLPDHPYFDATGAGLQKYADFDRGITNQTDGAYINKPDEGNTYGNVNSSTGEQAVPYFTDPWVTWLGGSTYFSPNRQVSSPGMLGSLPTGVHESGTRPMGQRREPWRTLLFRPQMWSKELGQQQHIGAPERLKGFSRSASGVRIGGEDPPDYLFMDFFWMPVVEPYAISEPGSTAGKLNLNYQMAPFRHIRRATAMHAAMKSEILTAVDFQHANVYLSRPSGAPTNQGQSWFWKEDDTAAGRKFWHRKIDVEATLKIFDERFSSGFAFISPAQICDMYLLPKKAGPLDTKVPDTWPSTYADLTSGDGNDANTILKFWQDHAITGENLKERPYANLYAKLTTRSNTFQVHVRSQVIKKARSTDPEVFDSSVDAITAEYRGSAVIERYLDLKDPALLPTAGLDYASGNPLTKTSLDDLHRFRVVSQKRFDP